MAAGLATAKGQAVVVMDADLQHPPDLITKMFALWREGFDVVSAVKEQRNSESLLYRQMARLFNTLMGGGATYRQNLAVVAHAGAVPTLVGLAILPLNYARSSMSSSTNLGVFVQMLPENNFLVRFLGTIDLMWVWYLIVLAIGLGVLYRRKTSSIAIGFFGVYLVIALAIVAYRSALGGS